MVRSIRIKRNLRYSEHLPFRCFVTSKGHDNVLVTKNGGFQAYYDFQFWNYSFTQGDEDTIRFLFNEALKEIGGTLGIWLSCQRCKIEPSMPEFNCDSIVARQIIKESYDNVDDENSLYVTLFTIVFSSERTSEDLKFGIKNSRKILAFQEFSSKVNEFIAKLSNFIKFEPLNRLEIIRHLHRHMYLDDTYFECPHNFPIDISSMLAYRDLSFENGYVKLGDTEISVLSLSSLGLATIFNHFGKITQFKFPYLLSVSFRGLDMYDSLNTAEKKLGRQSTRLHKVLPAIAGKSEVDNAVAASIENLEGLRVEIAQRKSILGKLTVTILLKRGKNEEENNEIINTIKKELGLTGARFLEEKTNTPSAWFSTFASSNVENARAILVTGQNGADAFLFPSHYNGRFYVPSNLFPPESPCLCFFKTRDNSPFFFNNFVGDVGHTLLVGSTGSGKSVLLAAMIAGSQQYNARVVVFDKGYSLYSIIKAIDGESYDADSIKCDPLSLLHEDFDWVFSWFLSLFEYRNSNINEKEQKDLYNALERMKHSGNLSLDFLTKQCHQENVRLLIQSYSKQWSHLFTSSGFKMSSDKVCYDFEKLHDLPTEIVYPLLDYLIKIIPYDGRPTYIFFDEAFFYLKNEFFREKIKDWMLTGRKKNVSIILSTPMHESIQSDSAILSGCLTKIFLPEPNLKGALKEQYQQTFGLSEIACDLIRSLTQKKEAFFTSPEGEQPIQINPRGTCLLFAKSDPESVRRVDEASRDSEDWQKKLLEECGMSLET